jgi:hypothetical protein
MEITFKKSFVLLAFICFTLGAKAQYSAVPDTSRLSVGIDGVLTNGGFKSEYKAAAGVSVQYDLPLNEKFYVTLNAGYLNFFANNSSSNPNYIQKVTSSNMSMAPLKVGIKFFLIRTFYIQGEVGQSLLLNRAGVYAINSTGLNYDGQMGILFRRTKRSYIDAGIRYQLQQSFYGDGNYGTMLAARIAYAFNLK